MDLMSDATATRTPGLEIVETAEGLSAIANVATAAVVWDRPSPRGLEAWLDGLSAECLPKARVVVAPARVRAALDDIMATSGTRACEGRERLVADIAELASRYLALVTAPYLGLRLDVVTSNACWKFHRDAVSARLVCTYRGTGTQYGVATDGRAPSDVFTVPTAAPIILRGTEWPETPHSGLLHRSPPIAGMGEVRLVLVLDAVTDPDAFL